MCVCLRTLLLLRSAEALQRTRLRNLQNRTFTVCFAGMMSKCDCCGRVPMIPLWPLAEIAGKVTECLCALWPPMDVSLTHSGTVVQVRCHSVVHTMQSCVHVAGCTLSRNRRQTYQGCTTSHEANVRQTLS
jgi:hypothetical protein